MSTPEWLAWVKRFFCPQRPQLHRRPVSLLQLKLQELKNILEHTNMSKSSQVKLKKLDSVEANLNKSSRADTGPGAGIWENKYRDLSHW